MQKSWHLDRRTFLRGTGVALSLPFLNSMALAAGPKTALPKRMCCVYFPFGVALPPEGREDSDWNWFPKGEGRDFQFRNIPPQYGIQDIGLNGPALLTYDDLVPITAQQIAKD